MSSNKNGKIENAGILTLAVFALIFNILIGVYFKVEQSSTQNCNVTDVKIEEKKPIYWVFSQHSNVESETGILKHVHLLFNRLGFKRGSNTSDWDLLWSHDYPFRTLFQHIKALRGHQLVNHFPGTGFITNKVDFATSSSKYIPKAFKIPEQGAELLAYAANNSNALFVHKDNQHRGVTLKNIKEIDLNAEGNFVQEYVPKPFLVDGHKFDIGVYTILTSVDPLRVYIYKGDVLFRYCPSKYHPFDPKDLDKYVIGDDYLPTWEVPSLAPLYTAMGYGMKDSFDAYVRNQGKDPSVIWTQVDDFLAELFLQKEHLIISGLKNYRRGANFFELMRFDFVIDEDLRLYALEANMSPNLSSAHYPPNQLLYEQVLYSVLALVGAAKYTHAPTLADRSIAESSMRASDKNLAVWSELCAKQNCIDGCTGPCIVCKHCLTTANRIILRRAVIEHLNRNDCRRVYPLPMIQGVDANKLKFDGLSPSNKLMQLWFQGKCNLDVTWCN